MIKLIKNDSGFSIIEAVVALGIIGIGAYGLLEGLDSITSSKTKVDESIGLEIILAAVVDEVRSNITREKVDFKAHENFLSLTNIDDVKDSLKMGWNKNGIQVDCINCAGKFGYVVSPYKVGTLLYRGLFEVSIRVTHDKLFPNRFKQYRFIVRGE
jgi:hypothetical protein